MYVNIYIMHKLKYMYICVHLNNPYIYLKISIHSSAYIYIQTHMYAYIYIN